MPGGPPIPISRNFQQPSMGGIPPNRMSLIGKGQPSLMANPSIQAPPIGANYLAPPSMTPANNLRNQPIPYAGRKGQVSQVAEY
jgi:hypothetical protein